MSRQTTIRTNLHPTPRSSTRRHWRVVNVGFPDGETKQYKIGMNETLMSVLRADGRSFDSYDDIEIEPVGRITY